MYLCVFYIYIGRSRYNSFSLAMDVLRHAGLVPSTNKIYGKKHTAIRDCFDLLSVLELVLLEFE